MIKRITYGAYNLLTARGDKERFIKRIAKICQPFVDKRGKIAMRVFLTNTWGQDEKKPLQAWPVIGRWNADYPGPKLAPVFDLGKPGRPNWNDAYWDNLIEAVEMLKHYGFEIDAVLEDFSSLKKDGIAKYFHPIRSNAQRYPNWAKDIPDHDPVIPDSWYGAGIWPYFRDFVWRVIQVLTLVSIPFELEPMNEENIEDMPDETLLTWHNRLVGQLTKWGIPKSRLVASSSRAIHQIAGTVGTFSCHGHCRPSDIQDKYFWLINSMIEISTDGGFLGNGRPDWKKRRGPSAIQSGQMAAGMIQLGYTRYEGFDRGIEGPLAATPNGIVSKVWANLDLLNGGSLKGFVDATVKRMK